MKTKETNNRLIEINQIKELISIDYRDLIIPNGRKNNMVVPGFMVLYGTPSKFLYMTILDPYFSEFVAKLREVYLEEKDQVISDDIFGKRYIEIDDISRELLLTGELDKTNYGYEEYFETEPYEESLLMEEDVLKALFPIVKYYLKESLKRFDMTITNLELSHGINGVYYLTTTIDNIEKYLPILFEPSENSFKITIGNLFKNSIPLELSGAINKKGITITVSIKDYEYYDETKYEVINDKIVKTQSIDLRDKLIHFQKDNIKETTQKTPIDIYELDSSSDGITWYELPWNAYLGLKEDKDYVDASFTTTDEEQNGRVVENKIVYISPTTETFYLKEIASKRYHNKIDDRTIGGNITLDAINKRRIGLIGKDATIVETFFAEEAVASGAYKEHLSGNYFYQVYKDLVKDSAMFIDKEQGLTEKSDLFDVKKYIKKEEK